ncbi:MAG: hypothetical protein ABL898_11075 [Hyphomicrobiaceae bacterium]
MAHEYRPHGRIASIFSTRFLASIAAAALVISSAGFGAYFAWSLNAHHAPVLGAFAVLMALGLETAKPLAVHGILDAARLRRFGEAAALLILATVAVGYSLTAELQLMARSRADAIAERQHDAGNASDLRTKRDRLQGQLDKITAARTTAELEPLIAAKVATTKGADCDQWVANTKTRSACLDLAQLRAEVGRATQRADLADKIEETETALGKAGAQKVADPSTAALATLLAAFGLHVNQSSIGDWLTLVGVFALEVGSMFAVVLVQTCRPNAEPNTAPGVSSDVVETPVGNTPRNAETPVETGDAAPNETLDETPCSAVQPDPTKLTVAEHPAERLVALLHERGGEVFGSQRTLGQVVGISAAQLNRVLHDLAASGRVQVFAGKSGTRVKLAA